MEEATPLRQQPLPSSSDESSISLLGTDDCTVDDEGGPCLAKRAWEMSATPAARGPVPKQDSRAFWSVWLVVACLSLPTLFFASGAYRPPLAFLSGASSPQDQQQRPSLHGTPAPVASPPNSVAQRLHGFDLSPSPSPPASDQKLPGAGTGVGTPAAARQPKEHTAATSSRSSDGAAHDDETLGGLLVPSSHKASCLSRSRANAYRKASPHKPSPYLLRRLREYEALHRRCGPHTGAYRSALALLKPGRSVGRGAGVSCKYVVWNPENGLGNRMLSLASTFLYSLLSRRVLLVSASSELSHLFCEPFPGSSWLLPLDFPLRRRPYGQTYTDSYGNLLRTGRIRNNSDGTLHRAFVYAHLSNDYDDYDKRFYCEGDQLLLEKIPWMTLRSDQYFTPGLFLNPVFEKELVRMFPEKEAIFHHLGRYLFHPSNEVWSSITKYYEENFGRATEILGIQIRVFDQLRPFDLILKQILNCTQSAKLLPVVDLQRHATPAKGARASKAVLLTSLHSFFYDRMKAMYSEHPAAGGERISVHQPSHEERQHSGNVAHDGKALTDVYLLSTANSLVTSSRSTFGYVAQALAGVTPWVLRGPVHRKVPQPSCIKEVSPEPCFHYPPNYDCTTKTFADTTKLLPYTTQCEDLRKGVKLYDQTEASPSTGG